MTDTGPAQPRLGEGLHPSEGKPAAFIAWGLYIASIPSAGILAPIGLVVAYAGRGSATGLARQHLDAAIALFWSVFWWTVVTGALIVVSALLSWLILPSCPPGRARRPGRPSRPRPPSVAPSVRRHPKGR